MKNCRKNAQKSSNGITLIALVITIIVLLILAGISISMLSGDNSILQKATTAKENTERTEIVENAKMDVLSEITENKGNELKESQLKSVLEKYFINSEIPEKLPSNLENLELTTLNSKYKIKISEIYNGSLARTGSGEEEANNIDVGKALALNLSAENVDERSPYVKYNGKIYKVLYNDDNGIEIIAMESIGTVTLGKNDEADGAQGTKGEFSRVQWSYNNAIQTLNKAAEALIANDGIVDDARCVGSVPGKTNGLSNKNKKNSTPYVHGEHNEYFSSYDEQFEQGEEIFDYYSNGDSNVTINLPNYKEDYNQMEKLGITKIGADYWIASRFIDARADDATDLSVCRMNDRWGVTGSMLFSAFVYNDIELHDVSSGLRPVFHLSANAKIKNDGGDGSSLNPYVLE